MVELNIEAAIANSVKASVENYFSTIDLNSIISDSLKKHIDNTILSLTTKIFNDIVSKRDLQVEVTGLINSILFDQLMVVGKQKLNEILNETDFTKLITVSVQNEVHRAASSYNFPKNSIPFESINLNNAKIDATLVDSNPIPKFNSTGINDQSNELQLTLTDDGIIIKNNISSKDLLVEDNSFLNNVTIDGEFIVNGRIGHSPAFETYVKNLADNVTNNILKNQSSINIADKNIVYNDRIVLSHDTLGPQIINSNLRKVGNLVELVVSGQAIINETLVVTDKKIGVNTENASGVLSAWDEDAEFTLVKHSPKTMFAGSTRVTDIVLGTNNQEQIKLKTDNTIELNGKLKFNGLKINIVDKIPENIGEPGEIAIMRDGSAIYRCISQNSWGKMI